MEDQIRLDSEVKVICAFHPNNPHTALTKTNDTKGAFVRP